MSALAAGRGSVVRAVPGGVACHSPYWRICVDVGPPNPREVGDMKRRIPEHTSDLAGHDSPINPGELEPEPQQVNVDRAVGLRALLTRGGVMVAGAVGAGVAGAAVAGPANAAVGNPVLQ